MKNESVLRGQRFINYKNQIKNLLNKKHTERVPVDLCSGGTVRKQRGTIMRNGVKNPTRSNHTFFDSSVLAMKVCMIKNRPDYRRQLILLQKAPSRGYKELNKETVSMY